MSEYSESWRKTSRNQALVLKDREDQTGSTCLAFPNESIRTPGDFRSWESPQTLPVLFIGLSEHVELFRNLKLAVKRITNIQSTVLSSSEGTAAIHIAFKSRLKNNKPSYYY